MTQSPLDIFITVPGRPVAWSRPGLCPGLCMRGKRFHFYDKNSAATAKQKVAFFARHCSPREPVNVPLDVEMTFYFPLPSRHKKSLLHFCRPDLDNLQKLVLDALTGIVWKDDSIICKITCQKLYAENPRTEIRIKEAK